jgi:Zn ribbon nucleic-acid-binding protein
VNPDDDGVPDDVKAQWRDCGHHDFETITLGRDIGVYLLECVKCGYKQRTDASVWAMLNRVERL